MDPYGSKLNDGTKATNGLSLKEVKEVITECGLDISRERIPLALGNKYIIEAKGQEGEYPQIILCTSIVAHKDGAELFSDYETETSHKKPINPDNDSFYSAIIRTKNLEDVPQNWMHEIEEYRRIDELIKGWNIEAVNDSTNPLWYKIVIGLRSDTKPAPNTLDKESLKEAITHIHGFGYIIDALIEKKQKHEEFSEDYVDLLVGRAISE